jgi:hypothetical protein
MAQPTTPFSTADLPKEGTTGRKVYDLLRATPEGLALFEIDSHLNGAKGIELRLDELASKGGVYTDSKKELEGGVLVDVWKARVPEQAKPKPGHFPPQKLDRYECPACGEMVCQLLVDKEYGGGVVWVESQKRLVVFGGPYEEVEYTDPETGETKKDQLPVDGLTLFEEWTGKLVLGRPATEEERESFAKTRKMETPWTIGYEAHLVNCKGGKKWISGAADKRLHSMDYEWDRESDGLVLVKHKPKTFANKAKEKGHEKYEEV